MKLIAVAILALTLAGCAMPEEEVVIIEAVVAESAVVEAAPKAKIEDCVLGEDDGIGGTGCSAD